jgi:hypothetical protein
MYATELAKEAVNSALEARGFHWPERGIRSRDVVLARMLAYDALTTYTGLSPSAAAEEVGVSPGVYKALQNRVSNCYPSKQAREAWLDVVRRIIEQRAALQQMPDAPNACVRPEGQAQ